MRNIQIAFLVATVSGALFAQTVTITPGYTNLGVNQTLQYTATVTGLTNTSVTWKVSGVTGGNATVGTISTTGLYKAPATVPTASTLVEALASDKKTLGEMYVNIEAAGPSITSVSPNPIPAGTTVALTITGAGFQKGANLNYNGANMGVTFVSSTTLKVSAYQGNGTSATLMVANPGTLYGPAISIPVAKTGPPPTTTIAPTQVTLKLGAQQPFTSNNATSWSASAGTVTSAGLYTAPSTLPASGSATVTAIGPGGSASATVTLQTANPQTISPTPITLNLGAMQQFTSAGATAWTAVAGTVTTSGFYTAPSTLPASGGDTVTATGPNGKATATVTFNVPTPVITSVGSNNTLPLGIFSATVTGSGFQPTSTAKLNGTALGTTFSNGSLTISGYASQSGAESLTVTTGSLTSQPFTVQVGVGNSVVSSAAARRFLEQGAFGPTPTDAAAVQSIGFQTWLNQQFAMAPVSNYNVVTGSQGGVPAHFMTNAVSNPDQLRQRVAFALSQIFVTSIQKLIWNDNMTLFQDMLLNDAFANYRQIMYDVTLSPAMGQYLDMANNAKADPTTGALANENYARELMQLFTIGTNLINQDGSLQHDSNNLPIPAYSQFNITEFARVYTGWTYAPAPGSQPEWGSYISSYGPMVPIAAEHDMGSKQLLNSYVAPANVTPLQDLNNALDNIFNHPNVGPFVAKQLIQHLVKSNPSPGYIFRVAAVFNSNSQGVRGDLKETVQAVLLDTEARANDNGGGDMPTDGHLQEPALFISAMIRAFGGTMNDQNYYSSDLASLGQDLFDAPSVFNYYSPSYGVPGAGLTGGEFQIHTPNNAILRANLVSNLFSQYSNPVQSYGPGTSVDLTPFLALAPTPSTLISALDLILTHGDMPAAMKSAIVTAVTNDTNGNLHRVQTACYLILTSSYYNVWH